jgi:serine/threonine protein kinase
LISCVAKFHQNKAAHRDIKPANLIISRNTNNYKLSDMGLSKIFKNPIDKYNIAGTRFYMLKEIYDIIEVINKQEAQGI